MEPRGAESSVSRGGVPDDADEGLEVDLAARDDVRVGESVGEDDVEVAEGLDMLMEGCLVILVWGRSGGENQFIEAI